MLRNEKGGFVARTDQNPAAKLDFAVESITLRPGWLRHVSRGQIETFTKLADVAIIVAMSAAATRAGAPATLLAPAAILLAGHAGFLKSGLYEIGRLIEPARAMRPLTAIWTLIFTVTAALPVAAPRGWLLTFYAAGLLGLITARWALEPLIHAWVAHGHCTKSVAIVGANEEAVQLIRRLRHNRYGIRVIGVFDDRASPAGISPLSRLGSVADLAAHPENIDLVVITLPLAETARIATVISQLRGQPFKLRILPGLAGLDLFSPIRLRRAELPGIRLIEVEN
jgi:FlaA1/EpsC-like NDP-sugar epimerase